MEQFWQADCPGLLAKVPGGHVLHESRPTAAVKVPASQSNGAVALGGQRKPGGHGRHVTRAASIRVKPGRQGVQALGAAAPWDGCSVPRGQRMGSYVPAGQKLPAGQGAGASPRQT